MQKTINIAYIDAANLDKGVSTYCDWKLDYKKFRIWLRDKYAVDKAHIFIGLIPKYKNLYTYLSESGFTLVFKGVVYQNGAQKTKGNCDTDLIMQATEDLYEGNLNEAILVASDGDYSSLVKKLLEKNKFRVILSPGPENKFSILLKKTGAKISYIRDQENILSSRESENFKVEK